MDDKLLANYQYRAKVKEEIQKVTHHFKRLEPKRETFVFSDGSKKELVNLQGTIPVVIKSTAHVMYIIKKRQSYQTTTGSSYNIPIIVWLMDTFPDNAPLCYLKPTPNMKINVSSHVDHMGKIYAPYLHDWAPGKSDLVTFIQVLTMLFSENTPLYSVPPSSVQTQSTPYPVQPPSFYSMPMPSTNGAAASYPYPSMPQIPPYPTPSNPVTPPYPLRPAPYPPYPVADSQPVQNSNPCTGTITEEHIRVSLLSAVEDKVRRTLREQVSVWKAELDTLEKIHLELEQGKNRLGHLISRLETEQTEWEKVMSTLKDKDAELDAALSKAKNQGEIDVDEAVVTTAPLYNQLLTAFAEEAATEDAIYYLGEGLRLGVIDLDVFLKHVRSLSRKQFMLRALMHKCRNKAGLAY